MKKAKEKYKSTLEDVRNHYGSWAAEDIEKYVQKLERENYGLKTTNSNLVKDKAKHYCYVAK